MRLNEATNIALAVGEKLKLFTDRIHIAGSIRRQKWEVKDIEIVCQPHYFDSQPDMFGGTATKVISKNYADAVKGLGKIIKGKPDGRYMQIELPQRINLDLFMPEPEDYFRQYTIRTGSADYVHHTIAKAWLRKGWCGSDIGLRRIEDCEEVINSVTNKRSWKCVNPHGERPPAWESEKAFFDWVGVGWIDPKLRTI